jgi:ABC-type glycerol-3-phosphate transport system substrate-binding protein
MRTRTYSIVALLAATVLLAGCTGPEATDAKASPQAPAVDGMSVADFPVVDGDVISDTGQDGGHTMVISTDAEGVFETAVTTFEESGYVIDEATDGDYVDKISAAGEGYSAVVTIAGTTATYVFTAE